jgi:RNA polymerase sigma-70 factor (ECF subfamily)
MSDSAPVDALLVERIRDGEEEAWEEFVDRFEGRLFAFAESRIHRADVAEDVVQETLLGFLTSLPNYDGDRPLESYLFSICAYKLTDHLRREGRRPAVSLQAETTSGGNEPAGSIRPASSLVRSAERKGIEEDAVGAALVDQVARWRERGDWQKLSCMELLFLRGWGNKEVAEQLAVTEQQVANWKFDFLARLKQHVRRQGLSPDIFPELADAEGGAG